MHEGDISIVLKILNFQTVNFEYQFVAIIEILATEWKISSGNLVHTAEKSAPWFKLQSYNTNFNCTRYAYSDQKDLISSLKVEKVECFKQ